MSYTLKKAGQLLPNATRSVMEAMEVGHPHTMQSLWEKVRGDVDWVVPAIAISAHGNATRWFIMAVLLLEDLGLVKIKGQDAVLDRRNWSNILIAPGWKDS